MEFAGFAEHIIAIYEHEVEYDLDTAMIATERGVHPMDIGFLPKIGLRISFD